MMGFGLNTAGTCTRRTFGSPTQCFTSPNERYKAGSRERHNDSSNMYSCVADIQSQASGVPKTYPVDSDQSSG